MDSSYSRRPFVVVTVICKEQSDLSYHELESGCDHAVRVAVHDEISSVIQIIYMPFYKTGDDGLTEKFTTTIDVLQCGRQIWYCNPFRLIVSNLMVMTRYRTNEVRMTHKVCVFDIVILIFCNSWTRATSTCPLCPHESG